MSRYIAALCLLLLPLIACMHSDEPVRLEKGLAIKPDQELQAHIHRVVETFMDRSATPPQWFQAFGTLWRPSQREGFFPQLFYYYCTRAMFERDREERTLVVLGFVPRLRIPSTTIAKVAAPYLDSSDNHIRVCAKDFLGPLAQQGSPGMINFSHYQAALHPTPPLGLVKYMFEWAPGAALLAIADVNAQASYQEIRWAEHMVADALWKAQFIGGSPGIAKQHSADLPEMEAVSHREALFQLEKLSRDDKWWCRLYVASILRGYPAFRTPGIVDRLKNDSHGLVREVIGTVEASSQH